MLSVFALIWMTACNSSSFMILQVSLKYTDHEREENAKFSHIKSIFHVKINTAETTVKSSKRFLFMGQIIKKE